MMIYEISFFTAAGDMYNLEIPAIGEDVWDSVWMYDKKNGTDYCNVIEGMYIFDVHVKVKTV